MSQPIFSLDIEALCDRLRLVRTGAIWWSPAAMKAIATVLSSDLETQRSVPLGRGPMDMAFHRDGRTALVGNQGDGTISVLDLEQAIVSRTIPAGDGVETLAFF